MKLYHGTDAAAAAKILNGGVQIGNNTRWGELGGIPGFYLGDCAGLAASWANRKAKYAKNSGSQGIVLEFDVEYHHIYWEQLRILYVNKDTVQKLHKGKGKFPLNTNQANADVLYAPFATIPFGTQYKFQSDAAIHFLNWYGGRRDASYHHMHYSRYMHHMHFTNFPHQYKHYNSDTQKIIPALQLVITHDELSEFKFDFSAKYDDIFQHNLLFALAVPHNFRIQELKNYQIVFDCLVGEEIKSYPGILNSIEFDNKLSYSLAIEIGNEIVSFTVKNLEDNEWVRLYDKKLTGRNHLASYRLITLTPEHSLPLDHLYLQHNIAFIGATQWEDIQDYNFYREKL